MSALHENDAAANISEIRTTTEVGIGGRAGSVPLREKIEELRHLRARDALTRVCRSIFPVFHAIGRGAG